jgi:hypothetical protein
VNKDIRLAISFKGHRKRKKLERMLGSGATGYLIDLWITVAQGNPKGVLHNWDEEDIACSGGWEGDPTVFVNALTTCGFIKNNGLDCFEIHDWEDHQGYVSKSEERSEQAKKAAETRWKKKYEKVDK